MLINYKKIITLIVFTICIIYAGLVTTEDVEASSTVASGTCGDNLTWEISSEGVLSIIGTGSMDSYTTFFDTPWYTYASDIKTITINDGVENIGDRDFIGCNVKNIHIPASICLIGKKSIGGEHLESISVDINNEVYTSEEGVLFNKDKTKLITYPRKKDSTVYQVPDSVRVIEKYAFEECHNLTNITIPNGIEELAEGTFFRCSNLIEFKIPNTVKKIGPWLFRDCWNLETIYIPNSITSMKGGTFENCGNIRKVYIDDLSSYLTNIQSLHLCMRMLLNYM